MAGFTKQAIKASFLKLLNEKPLSKISVRDIVEDCGINRNSFYYHFQDIPALLEEIVTEQTESLIARYPSIASLDECFQVAFRFAQDNRRAVMHIYQSVNRDIFVQNSMRLCESAVTSYINTAFPAHALDEDDRRIVIRFIKCQLFGMCIDWVSGGMKDDALADLRRAIELFQDVPEQLLSRGRAPKT